MSVSRVIVEKFFSAAILSKMVALVDRKFLGTSSINYTVLIWLNLSLSHSKSSKSKVAENGNYESLEDASRLPPLPHHHQHLLY